MGKKRQSKIERRNATEKLMQSLVFLDQYNGPIYRFFPERWQAEALCDGNVWISTLEKCRQYDDPLQGDPREASEEYVLENITGSGDDPAFAEMVSRSGSYIAPGCTAHISNRRRVTYVSDAYVLCTTKEFSPDSLSETFGNYCVKIEKPAEFFQLVSKELNKVAPINNGFAGCVQYRDRHFTGLQDSPGPIGFIKPRDQYASQKEFRLLWVPQNHQLIKPFSIKCRSIKALCTLITEDTIETI